MVAEGQALELTSVARAEQPPAPPAEDLNKVQWKENDPENPQNWSVSRKW